METLAQNFGRRTACFWLAKGVAFKSGLISVGYYSSPHKLLVVKISSVYICWTAPPIATAFLFGLRWQKKERCSHSNLHQPSLLSRSISNQIQQWLQAASTSKSQPKAAAAAQANSSRRRGERTGKRTLSATMHDNELRLLATVFLGAR